MRTPTRITGRFITIRGTKKLRSFGKKSEAPVEPFSSGFAGVFDGGPGKTGVFWWCFCGEFVVGCVVNVVRKMAVIGARKTCHFLQLYFQGLFRGSLGRPGAILSVCEQSCFEVSKAITICWSYAE